MQVYIRVNDARVVVVVVVATKARYYLFSGRDPMIRRTIFDILWRIYAIEHRKYASACDFCVRVCFNTHLAHNQSHIGIDRDGVIRTAMHVRVYTSLPAIFRPGQSNDSIWTPTGRPTSRRCD